MNGLNLTYAGTTQLERIKILYTDHENYHHCYKVVFLFNRFKVYHVLTQNMKKYANMHMVKIQDSMTSF